MESLGLPTDKPTTTVSEAAEGGDEVMIIGEVVGRELCTKVTIRDDYGEVITLIGQPAESLPRRQSR